MLSTRSIARTLLQSTYKPIRNFHQTPIKMVKVGDSIPNVELVEGSPGDKVNLSKELASGKGLIIGVPAAFSEYTSLPSKYNSFSVDGSLQVVRTALTSHQALLARPLTSPAMSAATSSKMPARSLLSRSMIHLCKYLRSICPHL